MTAPFKWPRKLTKAKLREWKLCNTHDLLRSGEPAIDYVGRGDSRSMRTPGWTVWARDRALAGAPWYDYGAKKFIVFGREEKQAKLEEATAWASQHFKVAEWVRTPFGSYVPREVAERVAGGRE